MDMYSVKADADQEHPATEATPYLAGHGMDATPVYFLPSNPINQACLDGRCLQVYHVKQDNVLRPVEGRITEVLRNQSVTLDPVEESQQHPPDRVERSLPTRGMLFPQFSWVDTSVGTAKRILGYVGDNIYNIVNPRKPNG